MRIQALFLSLLAVAPIEAAPPPPAGDTVAALIRDHTQSLVFIEDQVGAGSGFVATLRDHPFLFTNQHVIAGHPGVRCTLLDRSALQVGTAAAAVGHDVIAFTTEAVAHPLEVMTEVDQHAAIGDDVVVLGNAEGARVINPIAGKLVGVGPNLVEISAEFLPGNSGSPIVHVKTGQVIGIATFAVIRKPDVLNAGAPQIRRFGYRLDSIREWQPVDWNLYQQDFATVQKIESRTRDLESLLDNLSGDFDASALHEQNPALQVPIEKYAKAVGRRGVSAEDRARASQDLLYAMRSVCRKDLELARPRLRYDYFHQFLDHEEGVRTEFVHQFNELLKPDAK